MFTAKPMPGKFEGNRSQLLAQVVYNASLGGNLEWEAGDVDLGGWYGLVLGKQHDFLIELDNHGFVAVEVLKKADTKRETDGIDADFAETY